MAVLTTLADRRKQVIKFQTFGYLNLAKKLDMVSTI